jgi:hypothetical protein
LAEARADVQSLLPTGKVELRQVTLPSGALSLERVEVFQITDDVIARALDTFHLPQSYRGLSSEMVGGEVIRAIGLRVALGAADAAPDGSLSLAMPRLEKGDSIAIRTRVEPVALASATGALRLPIDRLNTTADLTLSETGLLEGHATIRATGHLAVLLDRFLSTLVGAEPQRLTAMVMQRQMLDGEIRSFTPLVPQTDGSRAAGLGFALNAAIGVDGRKSVPLTPGPRLVRGAHIGLVSHLREKRAGEVACPFQMQEQSLRITLPEGFRALPLPPDIAMQIGATSYRASYRRLGDIIQVERRLLLDAGGTSCSEARLREIAPVIQGAAHDMARRLTLTE